MSDRKLALLLFVLFAGIYAGTAGLRLVQSPALQMRRQINSMENARGKRLADPAIGNRLMHGPVAGGIAQMMIGREDHTGIGCGLCHGMRILQRKSERLFAEDMQPGIERSHRHGEMFIIRRQDNHRV